jgi:acylphosphatase
VSEDRARKAVQVVIRGRVQGVGFRAWVQHQAELHGLGGWVRNRADGAVEAVFSGPADLVDVMLKACESGPRSARVEQVERSSLAVPANDSSGFRVLPTE